MSWPEGEDEDEEIERRSPFTLEWPGLAAAERTPLTAAERQHAMQRGWGITGQGQLPRGGGITGRGQHAADTP